MIRRTSFQILCQTRLSQQSPLKATSVTEREKTRASRANGISRAGTASSPLPQRKPGGDLPWLIDSGNQKSRNSRESWLVVVTPRTSFKCDGFSTPLDSRQSELEKCAQRARRFSNKFNSEPVLSTLLHLFLQCLNRPKPLLIIDGFGVEVFHTQA